MEPMTDQVKHSPRSTCQLLAGDLDALAGSSPSWEGLEEFAQTVIERVYEERGKLREHAEWVNSGLEPDYQPAQAPRDADPTSTGREDGERLVGGIRYDSWAWEYSEALTPYLSKRMKEDPITVRHREKYGTLDSAEGGVGVSLVWDHLLALVKESGVNPKKPNLKLARLYLYLGKQLNPTTGKVELCESIPIPEKPVQELADLLHAVRELVAKYRVSNAAALFAITQDALLIYHTPYTVRKIDGEAPFRRIVLEVDPKLPAEDVKAIYSAAREKFGWKSRPINEKNLELASWAVRHEERHWEDLLASWELAYWAGSPTAKRRPYRPSPPDTIEGMSDSEVEAIYADYHSKSVTAIKHFMRDVNAAWRWVFGTKPPKRKEEGERTARLKAILAQIDEKRASGQTKRPMRYRTPIVRRAETPQEPHKKPRKQPKRGKP